jgi:soluble lytic murein transglycosylase-like protein
MIRVFSLGALLLMTVSASAAEVMKQPAASTDIESLVQRHAAANNVPAALVRRIIKRESGGNPRAVSKGNYGLMQIRLGTARAMGYRGSAAGLLDADTNMTYAVKYLAGAYKAAHGNADRAVHYYAAGYYYAAKRQGLLKNGDPNGLNIFASEAAGESLASNAEPSPAKQDLAAIKTDLNRAASSYTW